MTMRGAQGRIFDAAAATLAAKGYTVPAHWRGDTDRDQEPAAVVRAAAGRIEAPERAAQEGRTYRTPAEASAAVDRAVARVVADLAGAVSDTGRGYSPRELYGLLVRMALYEAQRRGYRAAPSQVTVLIGVEALAAAIEAATGEGFSRPTLWRRLDALRAAGLIATRRWFAPVDRAVLPGARPSRRQRKAAQAAQAAGEAPEDAEPEVVRVTAGTLVSVRLTAGRAHVHADDLRASWRDLEADIAAGRTWRRSGAQEGVNALEGLSETTRRQDWIITQALPPTASEGSVTLMRSPGRDIAENAVPAELSELFDLPALGRPDRAPRVDALARSIAAGLRDSDNLNAHRWTIWQALRLADQGQTWALDALYCTAQRVIYDAHDVNRTRDLRRPGARYVAALKESGVWDALKAAPANRVGVPA